MDLISTITLGAKGLLMASFLECNLVDFDELAADQQNFLQNVIDQRRIPDEDQALVDNNGNTYFSNDCTTNNNCCRNVLFLC